jgi:HD-like signal output (HDOD) protein
LVTAEHDTSDTEVAIAGAVSRGEINVPAYPAVALRLNELLARDDYNLEEVSELVSADPAVSGRVLGVANSEGQRSAAGDIVSLPEAIARLGSKQVAQIALGAAVSEAACSPGPLLDLKYLTWRQSLYTAFVARELARLRRGDSEAAFLCGLLTGLGRTVTLAAIEQVSRGAQALPAATWLAVVERKHRLIGALIAGQWELPESIQHALEPDGSGPRSPLGEVVAAAQRVVDELERSPALNEEALVALLPDGRERDAIVALSRQLPALAEALVAPRAATAGQPQPNLVTKPASELRGELHPVTVTITTRKDKESLQLQASMIGLGGAVFSSPIPFQENWVMNAEFDCQPAPVKLWMTVKLCEAEGRGHRVEAQPFAIGGDVKRAWANAVAWAGRSSAADTVANDTTKPTVAEAAESPASRRVAPPPRRRH